MEDADRLAAEIPTNDGISISTDLLRNFSFQARGNLQPVASFTGGIAAQEALKAVRQFKIELKPSNNQTLNLNRWSYKL